jgi:CRP-like cAMP-binding protein
MFGPSTATVTARGATRALALDYQRFHRFLLAFPECALALLKLTVGRLTQGFVRGNMDKGMQAALAEARHAATLDGGCRSAPS